MKKLLKRKVFMEEDVNILAKAITMWGHFIENMPEYSWMILPTLKDALQALHRYDDIEKLLIQTENKNNTIKELLDFKSWLHQRRWPW